jgi:hypothetical protein
MQSRKKILHLAFAEPTPALPPGGEKADCTRQAVTREYLLNHPMVRLQASSAAALL